MSQPRGEPEWQEGAGGLLLLAAAQETSLLCQLEEVLPIKQPNSSEHQPAPHRLFHPKRSLLLTLLFLPAVGLHRLWELRSYTGGELAVLTGRPHPYSYRHTERFLLQLSAVQADQALTKALARWTAVVWQVEKRNGEASTSFYVDGHRKAVYTETLIPRGLIGRLGKIAGCRVLVLLHDEQGHPLLVTTHRGDLHLTQGIPQVLTSYEQVTETIRLNHLVVDREAMAADAPLPTEHRGPHPDEHSQDQPIERTGRLSQRRSVCATHRGSPGHDLA